MKAMIFHVRSFRASGGILDWLLNIATVGYLHPMVLVRKCAESPFSITPVFGEEAVDVFERKAFGLNG